MTTLSIVAISGSPSASSKTALLVDNVLHRLTEPGVSTQHFRVRDLCPKALLSCDLSNSTLTQVAGDLGSAHGLIIATPIFKGTMSGMLKAFLDVLPQFALAGKAVLPLATGGSLAHVLALDYGLRPVLQSMGARHVVQSHFILDAHLRVESDGVSIEREAELPLIEAIRNFRHTLTASPEARLLGHPHPIVS